MIMSKPPKDLAKLKAALQKIVRVPKAEVHRRIAEDRERKRANRRS
jgi:hypothetical protein